MTTLPLDLIEIVADILASDDDPNLLSTKALSLACYDFRLICRKRIFAHVMLNNVSGVNAVPPKFGWHHDITTPMFRRLLRKSPELACLIRSLDYRVTEDDLRNSERLLRTFKSITDLRSFTLRTHGFCWNDHPLRPALLHLLHLPTLKDFNLNSVKDFLAEDLESCHLDHFGFDALDFCPSESLLYVPKSSISFRSFDVGSYSTAAVLNICEMKCTDGTSWTDFAKLKELSLHPYLLDDYESSLYLITCCEQLTTLKFFNADDWTPDLHFYNLAYALELSCSASKTLKYLEIHTIYEKGFSDDVYHGLAAQLEHMANKNVIEHIHIDIDIQMTSDCDRGDEWGKLDKALGTGWPHLRRCSVVVRFRTDSPMVDGLEDALLHVRETQFPTLFASQSLMFDFVIQGRLGLGTVA